MNSMFRTRERDMNSIWSIAFVIAATLLGKWLLFDNDGPAQELADDVAPELPVAKPPQRFKRAS